MERHNFMDVGEQEVRKTLKDTIERSNRNFLTGCVLTNALAARPGAPLMLPPGGVCARWN